MEIKTLKSKIWPMISSKKQKRELLNIVGDAQKWLFDVTEDRDRQDVLKHVRTNHNTIHQFKQTINKQLGGKNDINNYLIR